MEKETLRSKFLGSLIGTAVGDALEVGLEGHLWVDTRRKCMPWPKGITP
jgi:ADP-ribosylglycohydrolase